MPAECERIGCAGISFEVVDGGCTTPAPEGRLERLAPRLEDLYGKEGSLFCLMDLDPNNPSRWASDGVSKLGVLSFECE